MKPNLLFESTFTTTALISDFVHAQLYTMYHVSNEPYCLGSFFAAPGILTVVQGMVSTAIPKGERRSWRCIAMQCHAEDTT